MIGEYIISEDRNYKLGDGIQVAIEDGKFVCEVNEGGCSRGTWFCDIELLLYHIENYKKLRQLETLTGKPMSTILKGE